LRGARRRVTELRLFVSRCFGRKCDVFRPFPGSLAKRRYSQNLQCDFLESRKVAQFRQIFDRFGQLSTDKSKAKIQSRKPPSVSGSVQARRTESGWVKVDQCENPRESKQIKASQTTCVSSLRVGHAAPEEGQAGTKVAVSVCFTGILMAVVQRRAESCLVETGVFESPRVAGCQETWYEKNRGFMNGSWCISSKLCYYFQNFES
jgi:hypothetical protein